MGFDYVFWLACQESNGFPLSKFPDNLGVAIDWLAHNGFSRFLEWI
jgi:hypothetical protein